MKKSYYIDNDSGLYTCYYPTNNTSTIAMIAMMGDNVDDAIAKCGVKYFHDFNINVLALSPGKNNYDFANYPIENIGKAIEYLEDKGMTKIGILGASTTAMVALIASSYYNTLSLTIALSPSDFVMEGYHIKKDVEIPANCSTVTIAGIPQMYVPFYYRGLVHDKMRKEEAKKTGNKIACKYIFDEAEHYHHVTDREVIKTEEINGSVVVIGAEDDALWDSVKYINRMKRRNDELSAKAQWHYLTYKYGTHFVYPDAIFKKLIPFGTQLLPNIMFKSARLHPEECKETRIDIERKLKFIINQWMK